MTAVRAQRALLHVEYPSADQHRLAAAIRLHEHQLAVKNAAARVENAPGGGNDIIALRFNRLAVLQAGGCGDDTEIAGSRGDDGSFQRPKKAIARHLPASRQVNPASLNVRRQRALNAQKKAGGIGVESGRE